VLTDTHGRERLLVSCLSLLLVVRILTDDLSPNSRHSGSLNLSAIIALAVILLAAGLTLHRRNGLRVGLLAALLLSAWTAVAVHTNGMSTETLREGVREASVVALALIVYNMRGAVTVATAARMVQLAGAIPAIVTLYQLATFASTHRPHGTFAQHDSAAMYFALAAGASLWLYLDNNRHRVDALLTMLFAAGLIATASIDGLLTLIVIFTTLGLLRSGSARTKLVPSALAAGIALLFLVSPAGSHHIAKESATSLAEEAEPNSSLAWRFKKWELLIPEWEHSPITGRGLGVTTTAEAIRGNPYAGRPPHDEYIRYLVETGVLGVLILLAALAILIRQLVRARGGTRDLAMTNGANLALAVIAGCLVNSLADNTLLNSPTCYAATLIVAAALSVREMQLPIP
jgi:hypothetical protein